MPRQITKQNIVETECLELVLEERPGRKRLHYFRESKAKAIYDLFDDHIDDDRNLFKLPNAITG